MNEKEKDLQRRMRGLLISKHTIPPKLLESITPELHETLKNTASGQVSPESVETRVQSSHS